MKRSKQATPKVPASDDAVMSRPFAGLAALKSSLPSVPTDEVAGGAAGEDVVSDVGASEFSPKVTLAHQRKGRGGKTVTLLSGVLLEGDARQAFMRDLGKALGASVRVEGDALVISGDQRERASVWLKARGARKVVTSGG